MTQRVTIKYPHSALGDQQEQVDVKGTGREGEWELTAHAFLMPLGPGDIVRVDDEMNLVEIVELFPQFIYHVDLHHPSDYFAGPLPDSHPAKRISERLFEEWRNDAYVTGLTDFIVAVSSTNERWINDKVRGSKYVEALTCTRTPDVRSLAIEAVPVL